MQINNDKALKIFSKEELTYLKPTIRKNKVVDKIFIPIWIGAVFLSCYLAYNYFILRANKFMFPIMIVAFVLPIVLGVFIYNKLLARTIEIPVNSYNAIEFYKDYLRIVEKDVTVDNTGIDILIDETKYKDIGFVDCYEDDEDICIFTDLTKSRIYTNGMIYTKDEDSTSEIKEDIISIYDLPNRNEVKEYIKSNLPNLLINEE